MKWWFQGISNATVSVDTFLLISGLLVCYLLLAELERKKGKFNVGLFYLHRYLRFDAMLSIYLSLLYPLSIPFLYRIKQKAPQPTFSVCVSVFLPVSAR